MGFDTWDSENIWDRSISITWEPWNIGKRIVLTPESLEILENKRVWSHESLKILENEHFWSLENLKSLGSEPFWSPDRVGMSETELFWSPESLETLDIYLGLHVHTHMFCVCCRKPPASNNSWHFVAILSKLHWNLVEFSSARPARPPMHAAPPSRAARPSHPSVSCLPVRPPYCSS